MFWHTEPLLTKFRIGGYCSTAGVCSVFCMALSGDSMQHRKTGLTWIEMDLGKVCRNVTELRPGISMEGLGTITGKPQDERMTKQFRTRHLRNTIPDNATVTSWPCVPPECWCLSSNIHGATFQKTVILMWVGSDPLSVERLGDRVTSVQMW